MNFRASNNVVTSQAKVVKNRLSTMIERYKATFISVQGRRVFLRPLIYSVNVKLEMTAVPSMRDVIEKLNIISKQQYSTSTLATISLIKRRGVLNVSLEGTPEVTLKTEEVDAANLTNSFRLEGQLLNRTRDPTIP
ncbi:hypothetical protein J6590_081213 [Homalodisca vitripennis]|nr:hypothetical protein J6590_081213 [Homalodisca vitripennis]